MVEYGVGIVDLVRAIRRIAIAAVEQMTGLDVVEVNIAVDDLHVPGSEDDESPAPATNRVR